MTTTIEVPHGLLRAEQETVIRWDVEERIVHIWTADPTTTRKLHRLGLRPYEETRRRGVLTGQFYRLPLADFRWSLRRKVNLTDEERAGRRNRLSEARRARLNRVPETVEAPR